MYHIELLEQNGAQPPVPRKTITWLEDMTCTARMVIEEHVRAVHDDYHRRLGDGVGTPVDLQIYASPVDRREALSLDAMLDRAIDAFENGRFFILANGAQIDALNHEIELRPETRVVFVKLLPLVGG